MTRKPFRAKGFHTTPLNEAQQSLCLPVALMPSHGCIHLKPGYRDNLKLQGAFRSGTKFVGTNTMKKFRIDIFLVANLLTAMCACASSPVVNEDNSNVVKPLVKSKALDSVSLTDTAFPEVQAGYIIDHEQINYPAVAIKGKSEGTWIFPSSIISIFDYNGVLTVNDVDGYVYTIDSPNWVKSNIQIKPWSIVLNSDKEIVACTCPPLTKQRSTVAECYKNGNWAYPYSLKAAKPAICMGVLRLIEEKNKEFWLSDIALASGEVLKKTRLNHYTKPICDY